VTMYTAGPGESPGFLLWRVTLQWQRLITAALRPLDLTHVQFVLLASTWWLSQNEQAPHQSAIAAHANTNIKMTSEILRKLEDKGLIEQTTDSRDRRARSVRVTAAGARLAKQAVTVVETVDQEFFAGAPATFTSGLQALAAFAPDSVVTRESATTTE
jgi:DNA-binding MarR family transcriptional regulator